MNNLGPIPCCSKFIFEVNKYPQVTKDVLLWCKHFLAYYIWEAMFFKCPTYTKHIEWVNEDLLSVALSLQGKKSFRQIRFCLHPRVMVVKSILQIVLVLFWPIHTLFIEFVIFSSYLLLFHYLCPGALDMNPVAVAIVFVAVM